MSYVISISLYYPQGLPKVFLRGGNLCPW